MLLIGSKALNNRVLFPIRVGKSDTDYLCTHSQFWEWVDSNRDKLVHVESNRLGFSCFIKGDMPFEFRIDENLYNLVMENHLHDGVNVDPEVVYTLKMTHRFLKNSPHFEKTMYDIKFLREANCKIPESLEKWAKEEEKRVLNYSHPNLNTNKKEFFKDMYKYDHDSIHEAMAIYDKPAYLFYKHPKNPVLCSKKLFYSVNEYVRLAGCMEEALVLALERHQIPNDFKPDANLSFKIALEKVCTSITSGWFREFAWENYYDVIKLYNETRLNYVEIAQKAIKDGKIKLS